MKHCFSRDVHTRLFSPSATEWLETVRLIKDAMTDVEVVTENVDVLLKWSTWKLCDCSPDQLEEITQFLCALFSFLCDRSYQLSQYELMVFLPLYLHIISAQVQQQQRLRLSDVLKLITGVYPAAKLFTVYRHSLETSDETELQMIALQEMKSLITKRGLAACPNLALDVPAIARALDHNNPRIRSGASLVVQALHKNLQDDLWPYLDGDCLSKEARALLQRKLGAITPSTTSGKVKGRLAAPEGKPSLESKLVAGVSKLSLESSKEKSDFGFYKTSLYDSFSGLDALDNSMIVEEADQSTRPSQTRNQGQTLQELIQRLEVAKHQKKDDSVWLPVLSEVMAKLEAKTVLASRDLEKLISCLTSQLTEEASVNKVVSIADTLEAIYSAYYPHVTHKCLSESILTMIGCFLSVQKKGTRTKDMQETIQNSLRSALQSVLENSDPNSCLLILVKELHSSLSLPLSAQYSPLSSYLIKCLSFQLQRLTASPALISSMSRIPELFSEFHSFLLDFPPSVWKNRDNFPLNMIKFLLRDIVKSKKFGVIEDLKSLSLFTDLAAQTLRLPSSQMPVIFQYLNHLLKQESGNGQSVNIAALVASTTTTTTTTTTTATGGEAKENSEPRRASVLTRKEPVVIEEPAAARNTSRDFSSKLPNKESSLMRSGSSFSSAVNASVTPITPSTPSSSLSSSFRTSSSSFLSESSCVNYAPNSAKPASKSASLPVRSVLANATAQETYVLAKEILESVPSATSVAVSSSVMNGLRQRMAALQKRN